MNIHFILVEPAVSGNIGSCARAMKNMGFKSLRLVNPCDHLNKDAKMFAHASHEVLENAQLFSSLMDAIYDMDFIIGTSAKNRSVKENYYNIDQLNKVIQEKGSTIQNIGIIFGREESGLTNEELKLCDIVSFIPMRQIYPSLNLSQAVMLYAYELSKLHLEEHVAENMKLKNETSFKVLQRNVEKFLKDKNVPDVIKGRIFERLNILGEDDIHLLHSVWKHYEKNTINK